MLTTNVSGNVCDIAFSCCDPSRCYSASVVCLFVASGSTSDIGFHYYLINDKA
jgi:hypothetical protein